MLRRPEALRRVLAAAVLAGVAGVAGADDKPLWEFGLGVGALVFNDYRGSDTTHAYPLPIPYFVYRGQVLKSDHDGPRARFFNQERVELNLSVNATTPVINDSARHGMPDLKPTLEAGVSLNFHLWRSAQDRYRLDLRLPVRAAVTVQAAPHFEGLFAAPAVNFDIATGRDAQGWKLGFLAGPLFADHRYNAYFYTVESRYATPDRPAYEAHGGYAGTQTLASLTRRYPRYWVGFYVRHDTLGGATFAPSPLVRTNSFWTGGFAVTWMIQQSSHTVESED